MTCSIFYAATLKSYIIGTSKYLYGDYAIANENDKITFNLFNIKSTLPTIIENKFQRL